MIESCTLADHVLRHQFRRILEALALLHRRAGNAHDAAVDDGVAADGAHFLENADGCARQTGLDGGGKPRKARADDDDVKGFVPFGGHRVRAFGGGNGGACKQSRACGGLEQRAAGKVGHVGSPSR